MQRKPKGLARPAYTQTGKSLQDGRASKIRSLRQAQDPVDGFRNRFHAHYATQDWKGKLHFAFIFTFCCLGILLPLSFLALNTMTTWHLLCFPATWVVANFVEYFAHRYPMHRPWPGLGIVFERHTLEHHHFFTDRRMESQGWRDVTATLFPPVMLIFFFGVVVLPLAVMVRLLLDDTTTLLFISAATTYYFAYEILHFLYHLDGRHPWAKQRWLQRLSQHHRYHHDIRQMSHAHFNVTFPLADWLFGTLRRQRRN